MCDQDHFDDDQKDYEALGLVTRRQFGVLVGAGISLVLPQVVNAVAVTEADVTVKTPDGDGRLLLRAPGKRARRAGVLIWPDIFGLRPAFRQMGKRLAESGYSVLVVNPFYRVKKAPTAPNGAATPIADVRAARQAPERDHAHDRCQGVHRAGSTAQAVGREESQDRHAGLLHGRSDRVSYRGGGARPRRRRRVVPRRRTGDRPAEQPAPAGGEDARRSS